MQLIRLPEVLQMVSVGKTTWYSLVKDNKAPAPKKLGPRSVAWNKQEIENWISNLSCNSEAPHLDQITHLQQTIHLKQRSDLMQRLPPEALSLIESESRRLFSLGLALEQPQAAANQEDEQLAEDSAKAALHRMIDEMPLTADDLYFIITIMSVFYTVPPAALFQRLRCEPAKSEPACAQPQPADEQQ